MPCPALGFVLIYKSSRVLNIAHGQIIAAGRFYHLCPDRLGGDAAITFRLLLSMMITFFLAMSVERVFLRRLIGEPIISVIMVTIGLMSIIDGIDLLDAVRGGKFFFSRIFPQHAHISSAVSPYPGPSWWGSLSHLF